MSGREAVRDHAMAAAWGFAEATVFFIVPDLGLSWVALRNRNRALACTVSATAGAVAGGAVTYAWARSVDSQRSAQALARIPAISPRMVANVADSLAARPVVALLTGPFRGTPYKIYARAAAVQNQPLAPFLAWSVPARLPRFVLVTATLGAIAARVRRRYPTVNDSTTRLIFGAGWAAFYTWFFRKMGRS